MQKPKLRQSELHLVIPGICGPLSDVRSLESNREISRWIKTLARAQTLKPSPSETLNNANDVISAITGLDVEQDFPAAVLTMMANDAYDESLRYMHADPVHMRAELDHAILTSADDLAISKDESEALLYSLNKHFEADGLAFISIDEDRWVISSRDKISLSTTPLVDSVGRNVNFILPEGEGSGYWRQVLTEIQMLMHSHEVNLDRERRGQLTINSVWFHGSGELTENQGDAAFMCCSNQDILKGLSKHLSCKYLDRPDTVDDYMKSLLTGGNAVSAGSEKNAERVKTSNILHLAELESLVNYSDVEPWLKQLNETLNNWVYPLISFSNKNNINLIIYPCNSRRYHFSKYDPLKFWRNRLKKNSLDQYVGSYTTITR